MPLKTTHLDLRSDRPIILCATDQAGNPNKDPKSLSKISLEESVRDRVQINYSGPYTAIYQGPIISPRFKPLKRSLKRFDRLNIPEREILAYYNGNPLVLFRKDDDGNLLDDNVFSLVSFGRRINPDSTEQLKISYKGPLAVLSYEDSLRLNEDVYYRVLSATGHMQRVLERRAKQTRPLKRAG